MCLVFFWFLVFGEGAHIRLIRLTHTTRTTETAHTCNLTSRTENLPGIENLAKSNYVRSSLYNR